jgi:hypothetical protein
LSYINWLFLHGQALKHWFYNLTESIGKLGCV